MALRPTIFAYGQTGTGKTYTMGTGDDAAYADPGIVGRVVDDVFARMAAQGQAGGVAFTAKVSYLEIHNEAIRDLLHPLTRPALWLQWQARGMSKNWLRF